MRRMSLIPLVFLLISCTSPEGYAVPEAVESPTWLGEISPMIQSRCVSCHSDVGGAPGRFDRYEDAAANANLILAWIDSGLMPPRNPIAQCNHYAQGRSGSLGDRQRWAFRQWVEAGAPRGDDSDVPTPAPVAEDAEPPTPQPILRADVELRVSPWQWQISDPTERFLCAAFPPLADEDRFITGFAPLVNGDVPVHRMTLYAGTPGALGGVRRGGEVACDQLGGALPGGPEGAPGDWEPVVVWGRGGSPVRLPGTVRVPAGAPLILRIHYLTPKEAVSVDRSGLSLELTTHSTTPLSLRYADAGDFTIGTAMSGVAYERNWLVPWLRSRPVGRVWAVTPQLNALASSVELRFFHRSGYASCAANGRYSHLRQQTLVFEEPIPLTGADEVFLRCEYVNNLDNPMLAAVPPRDVRAGESITTDQCRIALWMELRGEDAR